MPFLSLESSHFFSSIGSIMKQETSFCSISTYRCYDHFQPDLTCFTLFDQFTNFWLFKPIPTCSFLFQTVQTIWNYSEFKLPHLPMSQFLPKQNKGHKMPKTHKTKKNNLVPPDLNLFIWYEDLGIVEIRFWRYVCPCGDFEIW